MKVARRDLAAAGARQFGASRDRQAAHPRRLDARTQFWLVLWDLECPYCTKSLESLAAAQRTAPQLKVVTISTAPMQSADEIAARLAQLGVRSDAYAFGDAPPEREAITGVIQLPR